MAVIIQSMPIERDEAMTRGISLTKIIKEVYEQAFEAGYVFRMQEEKRK